METTTTKTAENWKGFEFKITNKGKEREKILNYLKYGGSLALYVKEEKDCLLAYYEYASDCADDREILNERGIYVKRHGLSREVMLKDYIPNYETKYKEMHPICSDDDDYEVEDIFDEETGEWYSKQTKARRATIYDTPFAITSTKHNASAYQSY